MLYDFEGDGPSGELVVYTDEILTVTRTVGARICKACSYSFLCTCFVIFLSCLFVCIFLFFPARTSAKAGGKGLAPTAQEACFLKLTLR